MRLSDADIREIIRLLDDSPYREIELETDAFRLVLRRGESDQEGWSQQRETKAEAAELPAGAAGTGAGGQPGQQSGLQSGTAEPPAGEEGLAEVRAPIVGTFYRAPAPGAPPFVEVGSTVGQDTVVAIIEVMKLMNSVPAGVAGEVVEICAENAELVEQGECLIRVRPAAT